MPFCSAENDGLVQSLDEHNVGHLNSLVCLCSGDFPENWASAPDVASLEFLDRDFIFPGKHHRL